MTVTLAQRILDLLEKALMVIAALALVTMLFSISADAVGRYFFNHPLYGNYEITVYFSMVMVAFCGLPRTYVMGGHIRLTIFEESLKKVPYRIPARISTLLSALVFGTIAIVAGIDAVHRFENQETSLGAVEVPIYLSFVWFPTGCGLIALRLLLETFRPADHEAEDGIGGE